MQSGDVGRTHSTTALRNAVTASDGVIASWYCHCTEYYGDGIQLNWMEPVLSAVQLRLVSVLPSLTYFAYDEP